MIAVSQCKIKYNGCIRKAGVPFVANDSDSELLVSWGCTVIGDIIPEVQSPSVEPQMEENIKPVGKPQEKKPRKRAKT